MGAGLFAATKRDGTPGPGSGLAKIRGWHPDAQAKVERLQPYQRGYSFRRDPLWRLHDLNIADKHRLLHTVAGNFNRVGIYADANANWKQRPGEWIVNAGALEGRTKVASMGLEPIDPTREMHVNAIAPIEVVFGSGTPLVQRHSVLEVLGDIYNHVSQVVIPALTPYL
jgi:hypothetical protein